MSDKLIYAERLANRLGELWSIPADWDGNMDKTCEEVFVEIDNAPAVDAVEVVRCRECVKNPRIGTRTKGMVWCQNFRSEVSPNGFCSYGERRDENAVD